MSIPTLFTVDEVAQLTQAPRSSVLHWIYTGKLAALKVGRKRLVTEQALCLFLGVSATEPETIGTRRVMPR